MDSDQDQHLHAQPDLPHHQGVHLQPDADLDADLTPTWDSDLDDHPNLDELAHFHGTPVSDTHRYTHADGQPQPLLQYVTAWGNVRHQTGP